MQRDDDDDDFDEDGNGNYNYKATTTATAFDFAFWVSAPRWTGGCGGKGSHLVPRTDSSLCSWCMQLASSVCLFTQRAPRATALNISAGSILDNLPNSQRAKRLYPKHPSPAAKPEEGARGRLCRPVGTSSSIADQLISRSVPTRDGVKQTAITKH